MAEKIMNSKGLDRLLETILKLPNKNIAKKFFRDLCTLSELEAMSERFEVMKQIAEGINYREISQNTGTSTATVTRVAHWLKNGMGGYEWAVKELKGLTKRKKGVR